MRLTALIIGWARIILVQCKAMRFIVLLPSLGVSSLDLGRPIGRPLYWRIRLVGRLLGPSRFEPGAAAGAGRQTPSVKRDFAAGRIDRRRPVSRLPARHREPILSSWISTRPSSIASA